MWFLIFEGIISSLGTCQGAKISYMLYFVSLCHIFMQNARDCCMFSSCVSVIIHLPCDGSFRELSALKDISVFHGGQNCRMLLVQS